jgi:hypothetical protein
MRTFACAVLVAAATGCGTVRAGPETGPWSWVAERDDNGYLDTRQGCVYASRAEAQEAVGRFLRSNPEFMGRGWVVPVQPQTVPPGDATGRDSSGPPAATLGAYKIAGEPAITRPSRSSFLCGGPASSAAASG